MKIVAIEPTPNPNSMKLTMDEALPPGASLSFTAENAAAAPEYVRGLLTISGVRSVYQVSDFIALERSPQADWQPILAAARRVLESAHPETGGAAEPAGRVNVFVQMIRGIPMQIKLVAGTREVRLSLPERFTLAARQAAAAADFLRERRWADKGARYGDMAEIGAEVAAEIAAAYDEERVAALLAAALSATPAEAVSAAEPLPPAAVAARLADADWRQRYGALERLEPDADALPVVVRALGDSNPSVRRLAAVYLGEIGGDAVLPHLFGALKDPSAAVRRAAGDCLSDLGAPAAIAPMCEALGDPSKLVRWRAARFLFEVGDRSALPALYAAQTDPEFEVSLQAKLAIERIETGRSAVEPAWKQMLGE